MGARKFSRFLQFTKFRLECKVLKLLAAILCSRLEMGRNWYEGTESRANDDNQKMYSE